MELLLKLKDLIREGKLFKKGDRLVIAVSGGVDSVTLLFLMIQLSNEFKLDISVAHLNHGLREESDSEEKFVKKLAAKYKLKFFSKKVKLPQSNIEEKAREERYAFLGEVKKETKSKYILTAHNLNDNAETVLLNLTRGSGIKGLSGMKLKENELVRPMIGFKKSEILEFAGKNKISWKEDPSNKLLGYSRNRIRAKVLPELEKINLEAVENIVRSAELLAEISYYLKKKVDDYLKVHLKDSKNEPYFETTEFKKLNPVIQKEVLMEIIRTKKSSKNITNTHIQDILRLISKTGTKEIHLPSGLIIRKIYDRLMFVEERPKSLKIPSTQLKIGSKKIFSNIKVSVAPGKLGQSNQETVFIDEGRIKKILVRSRKEGDRIYIAEDKQKKVKEIFIESKIPRNERDSYPILTNEKDEVIWLPLIRQDERFRAGESSKKILVIKAKKIKSL